jgi:multimeric flavodoxin WrbA
MKVILVNGSRRKNGCTFTALTEVSEALKADGIDTELFFIGDRAVNGEIDAAVKEVGEAMKTADGLIVGAPVYYASPSGEIIAFLDRLFSVYGKDMIYKPGSAITSARRAGTTASLDVMNKYFTYNRMPLVSSRYWNMVHGSSPDDVNKDEEGLQIMRFLGHNMAWLLKCIEAGKKAGIEPPAGEDFLFTNFIR